MDFCKQCDSAVNYIVEGDSLFTVCRICQNKEEMKGEEKKIYSEIIDMETTESTNINPQTIYNKVYPIVEKNGEIFTVAMELGTNKKKYISHKTKKIYDKI
jgi:DNA-directed RNA polymerase subunit M/transcription elongation factor TFIIS